MFLKSKLIPINHGFSTRVGGISEGPYSTLNLGLATADVPERVVENQRRLAYAAGLKFSQWTFVNQVHGVRFIEADLVPTNCSTPRFLGEADGLFTNKSGVALAIRTADCVPVLLYASDVRAIAVVHAGWKGTEQSIAFHAVNNLVRHYGASSKKIFAAIGPSIRACCYSVGEDIARRFSEEFSDSVISSSSSHIYLDLAAANQKSLIKAGVPLEQIDILPFCTHCDVVRFFSHRRDKGVTGRHLSFAIL